MIKIYGSELCPDCRACKKNFETYKIPFEFIDINSSMKNLHEFMLMRDTNSIFDHSKKVHDIGIPALVKEDGTVFLSWEKYVEEKGFKVLPEEEEKTSCSLSGKGC